MPRPALASIALALALAILGVLGYKLSPRLFPRADLGLPAIRCDLNLQPCSATLPGGGQLTLSVMPRPIRPLQQLQLSVHLSDVQAERVEVDFDGVDMRMGLNRVRLAPPASPEAPFSGQGMLPVCVSGDMQWAASVLLDTTAGRIAVPFHFPVPAHAAAAPTR